MPRPFFWDDVDLLPWPIVWVYRLAVIVAFSSFGVSIGLLVWALVTV